MSEWGRFALLKGSLGFPFHHKLELNWDFPLLINIHSTLKVQNTFYCDTDNIENKKKIRTVCQNKTEAQSEWMKTEQQFTNLPSIYSTLD